MKNVKLLRFGLFFILISLWILYLFYNPIEDFDYTYFNAFTDAIFEDEDRIAMFTRVIIGLPFASLLILSLVYRFNRKQQFSISISHVKRAAVVALVINVLYSTLILAMDGFVTELIDTTNKVAKQSFGFHSDALNADEVATIFYWFNILVPCLFLAFIFIYRHVTKIENKLDGSNNFQNTTISKSSTQRDDDFV